MARPTRTYKLKVSPAGFDMIVESHARFVRVTRTLLPYGLALHAALHHLAALDDDARLDAVREFPRLALGGGRSGSDLFVGAPRGLSDLADGLLADLSPRLAPWPSPGKADLYLIALHSVIDANTDHLLSAYGRVAAGSLLGQ